MKQFTLKLSKDAQRPIVILSTPFRLDAMLDTGATFPIWTAAEDMIADVGGKLKAHDIPFGGFGGMTKGNLYEIPNFCVGDLIFPSLPVIVSPRNLPCQMLLSATMFSRLIYEIDDRHHQFNVTIPEQESTVRNLTVKEDNGRLHIFCNDYTTWQRQYFDAMEPGEFHEKAVRYAKEHPYNGNAERL